MQIRLTRSRLVRIVLSAIAVVSVLILLKVLVLGSYPDFNTYYYGVQTVMHGGNPYVGIQKDGFAFVYPPPAVLLLFPFSLLPFSLAGQLFTLASLACLVGSIWVLFKLLNVRAYSALGILFVILICNFFPVKFTLGMGQVNLILLLLVSLFTYCYSKQRDRLAGVLLGLAFAIKLFPALLFVYLVLERRWVIVGALVATVAASGLVTLFVVPLPIDVYFFKTSLPSLASSWKGDYYNQAVSGWLMRDVSSPWLREVLRAATAGVLVVLSLLFIWRGRKTAEAKLLGLSIVLTVSLIINSFSWQHHFVWLVPSFLITTVLVMRHKLGMKYYVLLGLSYILVAINLKDPNAVPVLLQSHVLYGAILLYAIDVYLLAKKKLN